MLARVAMAPIHCPWPPMPLYQRGVSLPMYSKRRSTIYPVSSTCDRRSGALLLDEFWRACAAPHVLLIGVNAIYCNSASECRLIAALRANRRAPIAHELPFDPLRSIQKCNAAMRWELFILPRAQPSADQASGPSSMGSGCCADEGRMYLP